MKNRKASFLFTFALLAAVALSSCGGGNGGSNTPPQLPQPPITKATLVWRQTKNFGTPANLRTVTIINGNVLGAGDRINNTNTGGVGIAVSYTSDGTLQGTLDFGSENQDSNLFCSRATQQLALVGGQFGSLATLVGLGPTAVKQFENSCPSTQFTGGFTAISQAPNSTIYLGLAPSIATADADGNINCTAPLIQVTNSTVLNITGLFAGNQELLVAGTATSTFSPSIMNNMGFLVKMVQDGSSRIEKDFNGVFNPKVIELKEGGSSYIYLVGTYMASPPGLLMWIDKLDENLNELPGWPKTWDGDNTLASQANYGEAVVPNPAGIGGIIAVGVITELAATNPLGDSNKGDCGLIAYGPDGSVLWKVRQDFFAGDVCQAAAVDPSSLSLFVAGSIGNYSVSQPQTLVAKFALPH